MPPTAPTLVQTLRRFNGLDPCELSALLGVLLEHGTPHNHAAFQDITAAELARQAAAQLELSPPGALTRPLLDTLTYRIWLALFRAGWRQDAPVELPAPSTSAASWLEDRVKHFPGGVFLPALLILPAAWILLAGREPHLALVHEHAGVFGHRHGEILSWSASPWEVVLPPVLLSLLLALAGLALGWILLRRPDRRGAGSAQPILAPTLPSPQPVPAVAVDVRRELEQQVALAERSGDARWRYDARLALHDLLPRTLQLHRNRGARDNDPVFLSAMADVLTIARREPSGAAQRPWDEHVAFLRDRVTDDRRAEALTAAERPTSS